MKRVYEAPVLKTVVLESADVITYSGATQPNEIDNADVLVSALESWFK